MKAYHRLLIIKLDDDDQFLSSNNSSNNNSNNGSLSLISEEENENNTPTVIDAEIVQFMLQQVQQEQLRLKKNGANVTLLKVKNTAIIREHLGGNVTTNSFTNSFTNSSTNSSTNSTEIGANKNLSGNTKKKNTKKKEKIINRIEFNSDLNFDKMIQLLLSPAIKIPNKKDYFYINIILLNDKEEAFLCPYVYKKEINNNLQNWALINNNLQRTDLSIQTFKNV
ncbi:hypothetical protein ABK040_011428 [Willaertia magna]